MNELSGVVTDQSRGQGRFWVHISSLVLSNCPGHVHLKATIPGVGSAVKLGQSQLLCSETLRVKALLFVDLEFDHIQNGESWSELEETKSIIHTPSSRPFLPNPLPTRPHTLRASAYGIESRDPGRRQT